MAYYEKDYIEIKRENGIMTVVGTRREGVELSDLPEYLKAKRKSVAVKSVPAFVFALIMGACLYAMYMLMTSTVGGKVLPAIMGVLCAAGFIWCLWSGVDLLRSSRKIHPEDQSQQLASVAEALDWKLKTRYGLCEMHDMVSVESAAKGAPVFIGSLVMPQVRDQRTRESALLTQCARAYLKAQQAAAESAPAAAPASAAGPRVADLRSEAEKAIENASGNQLLPEREALAQEMFLYLKTHDTGNNPEHYREFRTLFHERSEAIAEGGGYHQALQEIYYRIRQLCGEQGVYFHAGGVGHVFEGEYWRN